MNENGQVYYLAEALCDSVLGEGTYQVLESCKGKELEYKEYEPLFPYARVNKKAYYVVCDTYVTLTEGTGIVHIAPAFGEDDSKVGRRYDLPFVQLVNGKGRDDRGDSVGRRFLQKSGSYDSGRSGQEGAAVRGA